jgi:hypothetical protein
MSLYPHPELPKTTINQIGNNHRDRTPMRTLLPHFISLCTA